MEKVSYIQMTPEELVKFGKAVAHEALEEWQKKPYRNKLLTTEEAAAYCKVSVNTIINWKDRAESPLKYQKQGARNYFKIADLDEMMVPQN